MNRNYNRINKGLIAMGVASARESDLLRNKSVEIWVDSSRLDEFTPAVWALAAASVRQFSGEVYVRAPRDQLSGGPIRLDSMVTFGPAREVADVLRVGVGCKPDGEHVLWADNRGDELSFSEAIDGHSKANPIGCFALAGYLAFACLARACGIPEYQPDLAQSRIVMPSSCRGSASSELRELLVVGTGHVGQAALALLHFLGGREGRIRAVLWDKDRFGEENLDTQILIPHKERDWIGELKAPYLSKLLTESGWNVTGMERTLTWSAKRRPGDPCTVLAALDRLDTRRMMASLNAEWMIEAGVGRRLDRPRVTWSACKPESLNLDALFGDMSNASEDLSHVDPDVRKNLRDTPGGCGWLTFKSIAASAPALGLVASAYAVNELVSAWANERKACKGSARLWSPGLLPLRRPLT